MHIIDRYLLFLQKNKTIAKMDEGIYLLRGVVGYAKEIKNK